MGLQLDTRARTLPFLPERWAERLSRSNFGGRFIRTAKDILYGKRLIQEDRVAERMAEVIPFIFSALEGQLYFSPVLSHGNLELTLGMEELRTHVGGVPSDSLIQMKKNGSWEGHKVSVSSDGLGRSLECFRKYTNSNGELCTAAITYYQHSSVGEIVTVVQEYNISLPRHRADYFEASIRFAHDGRTLLSVRKKEKGSIYEAAAEVDEAGRVNREGSIRLRRDSKAFLV